MSGVPPYLQQPRLRNICLVLEGYEEEYYFKKIIQFPCFRGNYNIQLKNAKTASNIPGVYQAEYSKNIHDIVLVVCDKDRVPTEFENVVAKLDLIHGAGKAKEIIIFTCPCTLQIILSHFGDVTLTTQAKKAARSIISELTGVDNYDAHHAQLDQICSQIHFRTYEPMKERVRRLSTCMEDIPSTNILSLFENLESSNTEWIDRINALLSNEDD